MPVARMPVDHREDIRNRFKSFREQIDLNALVFNISLNKEFLHLHAAAGAYHDRGALFRAAVSVVKGDQIGQLDNPGVLADLCATYNAESPQPQALDIPEIRVIKSTKFMKADGQHLRLYHTRGRKRGVLLILSYFQFSGNVETFRTGVEADCLMLERVFSAIGFRVINHPNLSEEETKECLRSIELEGYESVFVVVSSHGYSARAGHTSFRTADGGYMLAHDLVDYFNEENYPELRGVPKVFIFQTCRGKKLFPKWKMDVSCDAAAAARRDSDADDPRRARLYSDILIAYSTVPGYTSPRIGEHERGCTWYMRALCGVLAARAHHCHALELLALVDERLRARGRPNTCTYENWGFNRLLYLHPGLAEEPDRAPAALLAAAVLVSVALVAIAEYSLTPRLGRQCLTVISFLPRLWRFC